MTALASIIAASSTGCTALAIVTTVKEPQSTTVIDARVTTHQADLSGQLCYVEKRVRTVSIVHINPKYAVGALIEALVFGIALGVGENNYKSFCGPTVCPENWAYGALALDGVTELTYAFLRNNEVSTSDDWQQTSETQPCVQAR